MTSSTSCWNSLIRARRRWLAVSTSEDERKTLRADRMTSATLNFCSGGDHAEAVPLGALQADVVMPVTGSQDQPPSREAGGD